MLRISLDKVPTRGYSPLVDVAASSVCWCFQVLLLQGLCPCRQCKNTTCGPNFTINIGLYYRAWGALQQSITVLKTTWCSNFMLTKITYCPVFCVGKCFAFPGFRCLLVPYSGTNSSGSYPRQLLVLVAITLGITSRITSKPSHLPK